MDQNHFNHMRMALEIESQSAHPTHKVGALICGRDVYGHPFTIAHANYWPPILAEKIGRNEKLGNASTTVHAEIAAICSAPSVEGASIYVTDLPCPNCSKAIVEARIKHVYIDSHTHHTPLGEKMKPFFEGMSMPIFEAAGVGVYEMNVESHEYTPLHSPDSAVLRPIQYPVFQIPLEVGQINHEHFKAFIAEQDDRTEFAACYAKSPLGKYIFLCARVHRSIGLTSKLEDQIHNAQDKYESSIQPINRLLLNCARYGLKIDDEYLYSSQVPTSREFVNMIGAGHFRISIGDIEKSRDEWGIKALHQLRHADIVEVK